MGKTSRTISADLSVRTHPTGSFSGTLVEFENQHNGVSIGGLVKIQGAPHKSRTEKVGIGVTATAYQSMQVDRVQYTFSKWTKDGIDYSSSLSINPTSQGLYVAVFNFDYVVGPDEINPYNDPVGYPIRITWKQHTSDFVDQIQVWRSVAHVEADHVIATLPRNATQYIDNDYALTNGYTDKLVNYDIRVRYSLDNSYSSPAWFTVYGTGSMAEKGKDTGLLSISEPQVPKGTSFRAYPNPFNPSTVLSYSLNKDSYVEISVFNLTGITVGKKAYDVEKAGEHTIQWDAKDQSGNILSTGVYFVRFSDYPMDGSKPLVLYHRLLLVK